LHADLPGFHDCQELSVIDRGAVKWRSPPSGWEGSLPRTGLPSP
jgi:hypothetical protein